MKRSIYSWFGYYLPIWERLDLIKNAGFDGVMLSWEDEYPPFEVSRFEMAEKARNKGLEITNVHGPFEGFNDIWKDNSNREIFFKKIEKILNELGELEIPSIVLHTTDSGYEKYLNPDLGIDFFTRLAEIAEKVNVNISIENVSRPYLIPILLDNINHKNIGFCFDSGHENMLPCVRGKLLEKYYHRLTDLHLQDNDLIFDRHWLPGEGKINFTPIINNIHKSPIQTVSLEVNASPIFWKNKPAEEFLNKAFHSLDPFDKI